MNNQETKTETTPLEWLELSDKPTVVITEKLQRQINHLHRKCGGREWSGELITSEIGKINDLDEWKIICEEMFLVDVGTSGYTAYEVDKGGFKAADVIQLYDTFPGLMEGTKKAHHIHTHHSMSCFFSGTDKENLTDRGSLSNYFMMLIVNFKGEYCAKVAFKANIEGKKKQKLVFANNADGIAPLELQPSSNQPVLVVMDCKIEYPSMPVENELDARIEIIAKAAEEEVKNTPSKFKPYMGYFPSNSSSRNWEQGEMLMETFTEIPSNTGKPKNIMDMTDAEWKKHQESYHTSDAVFSPRDVNIFINSILSGGFSTDSSSCISNLMKKNDMLSTKIKLEEFVYEFTNDIPEYYDMIFPNNQNNEDYLNFLSQVKSVLKAFTYNRLIKEIYEEFEAEAIDVFGEISEPRRRII